MARQERERGQRLLAAATLIVLVLAFLTAAWLIAVGLWWVVAIVGVVALIITIFEGLWKP